MRWLTTCFNNDFYRFVHKIADFVIIVASLTQARITTDPAINLCLQMKDVTYYNTAQNVAVSPRMRRRAKIYKLLESKYLDKEEPVCIRH